MTQLMFVLPKLAVSAALLMSPPLYASEDQRYVLDETYRQECGECHVAYPPALLPADTWRQVMRQLDRHYGVDASLEDATAARITKWLEANAGSKAKLAGAGDPPRLTQTVWFRHEHDEAPSGARRNAGSMARCDACHRGAAGGDYSEHDIRLPSRPVGAQP